MKRLLRMNRKVIGAITLAIGALSASGCATDMFMSTAAYPRVEDCMIIGQGTPSKFVCSDGKDYFSTDGKTFTSIQLVDARTPKTADKK